MKDHRPVTADEADAGRPHRTARQQSRRLAVATGLNVAIVAGQVVAGFAAGSIGLLADAGHNLADALAVGLALVAVRLAARRPSSRRTFGGLRWPVLAAQANAASLLLVSVWLAIEAARRLAHPTAVEGGVVLVVALAAAALNGLGAALVHERDADLNTRGAVLHLASDAAVSLAVAAAGAVIWAVGGWYRLDPLVSLVVVLLVGWQGVHLLRQSSRVLLEAPPRGVDPHAVQARLTELPGVVDVHDVHVWSLSDRMHAASVHVSVEGDPRLTDARACTDAVKELMRREFGIDHATVELETASGTVCTPDPGAYGACAVVQDHLEPNRRRSRASSRS
jgi:cobalt-zinc-cadmium efflux system protein